MPNRLSLLQQMMSHRKTASIPFRPRRGILIVDSQGLGDVVCSLPLLQSVCRWSNGQFPIYVLLQSADCFELIRAEVWISHRFTSNPSITDSGDSCGFGLNSWERSI